MGRGQKKKEKKKKEIPYNVITETEEGQYVKLTLQGEEILKVEWINGSIEEEIQKGNYESIGMAVLPEEITQLNPNNVEGEITFLEN